MSRIKFDVRYRVMTNALEAPDISYKNLDDYKTTGVYQGFNVQGAPDENYVQIIVTKHTDNWIVQECKDYIDTLHLRSFKNNRWSKWTELTVEHDCNEPDKEYVIIDRPHTHPVATHQHNGFMSKEDKAKLDALTINGDGNIIVSPGDNLELMESIEQLKADIEGLNANKSDINHNHDERYIPAYSSKAPTNQNVVGQVWIQY